MDQNEKKRCTNFTKNEIDILLELVDFHKDIVECKKTDCVSNAAKDAEWCKIAVKFNALCGTGRAARMLRNKWDSLKKTTKKEYSNIRMKTYKTGGGPFTDVKLTGVGNRVLALIGIAAKGTNSEFDCDAVDSDTTVHNTTANVTQSEVIGEWVEMENLETVTENVPMDAAIVIEGAEVLQTQNQKWDSWSPSLLRQPKHPVLQAGSSTMTEKPDDNCIPTVITPIKESRHIRKRKRSNIVTPQCETRVYEELARRKIEFIDFQKRLLEEESKQKEKRDAEMHELKIKIMFEQHNLNIKILEADLKNKTK